MALDAANRQARSLDEFEHRPWPLASSGWRIGLTCEDVVFAHWRASVDDVRRYVPAELDIETHDGAAWIGIVSLRVSGLRARGLLPLPRLSRFLELNVRTYVSHDGGERPGVWFLGLDVSSRLAVEAARRVYKLPVAHARMSATRRGEWIDVECARVAEAGRVFSGRVRPSGPAFRPEQGSLEHFLTERYCLYTSDSAGGLLRAEIHHVPWLLQPAVGEIGLASVSPLALAGEPACHVSSRQDLVAWPLEPVG